MTFKFNTSNNQAEYEALILGMTLALEVGTSTLQVKSDSQMVAWQVSGDYQANAYRLIIYLKKVHDLSERFKTFEVTHVPSKHNFQVDLLSMSASLKKLGFNRTVI